jgi:hypothetical protein
MAISKIPSAGFQDNVKFRNLIINGDMSIAQRGTSQASITASGYYTVDRWKTSISSLGTWTQTQSTDVPTGQGFAKSLKLDCTTADASPSASDVMFFQQAIEGQNLQYLKFGTSNAQQLTLSFWVKTNKTGTYICEIINIDNSTSVSKSYTINSANTWEKKTINIPADTSNGFDNDNADSLRVYFWLGAGSNYTSGTLNTSWNSFTSANRVVGQVNLADNTANEWLITGVQLESGSASDFEFLPFDIVHNRCLRYYTTSQGVANWGSFAPTDENAIFGDRLENFSNVPVNHRFSVRMRATPTVTTYSLTGTSGANSDTGTTAGTHAADDACSVARVSESGIGYLTGVANGVGDGLAFQYEADAEL